MLIWTGSTPLHNVAYTAAVSFGAVSGPLAGAIVLLGWAYVLGLMYGVAVSAKLEAVRARSVDLETPRSEFDQGADGTGPFAAHLPRPSHLLLRSPILVVVTAVFGVALGLVAALRQQWLLPLDEPVADAIRGDSLVGFFRFFTRLGSQQDVLLAAAAVGVLLWRRCRPSAVAVPAAVLAGVVVDVTLKVVVDRPRPPDPLVGTALGSFPSGHALTGVIFFGLLPPALWIALRRRLLFWVSVPLSAAIAVLVATSRIYLGGHWPTDVLASALLGAAILLGTELLLGTRFARRHCDGCPLHTTRAHGPDDTS